MYHQIHLLLICMLCVQPWFARSKSISWEACRYCDCMPVNSLVKCTGKFFTTLPTFPNWTETLHIWECHQPTLPANSFSGLKKLKVLRFAANDLKEIDAAAFGNLPQLESVDLSFNPLETIPSGLLRALPFLKYLNLSNTHLRDISYLDRSQFHANVTLEELNLGSTRLATASRHTRLPSLKRLLMQDVSLAYWRDEGLRFLDQKNVIIVDQRTLEVVNFTQCGTHIGVNFTTLSSLKELHISSTILRNESFQALGRLETLRVLDFSLGTIKGKKASRKLHWSITAVRLEQLDLTDVGLDSILVYVTLHNLTKLTLPGNRLEDFNFQRIPAVVQLDLSRNRLTDVPAHDGYLRRLTWLDLSKNDIDEVTAQSFTCCPSLEVLNLSNNRIYHFDHGIFNRLRLLEDLVLEGNVLDSFDFVKAENLRLLWLRGDTVNTINRVLSCENVRNVELVFSTHNELLSDTTRSIESNALERVDLEDAEMDNLVMLDLGDNPQLLSVTERCTSQRFTTHAQYDPTDSQLEPTPQYQCWPTWLNGLAKLKRLDTLVLRNTGLHAWPQSVFLTLQRLTDLDVSSNHLTSETLLLGFNRTGTFCIQALNLSSNNIIYIDGLLSSFLPDDCLLSIDLADNLLDCSCSLGDLITHRNQVARFDPPNYACYLPSGKMSIEDYWKASWNKCAKASSRSPRQLFLIFGLLFGFILGPTCCVVCYRRRRRRKNFENENQLYNTHYTLLSAKLGEEIESPVSL